MSSPLVTVAMVAYNAERFIGESIEGVLSQTFSDFELVVIDDGSEDGTVDVVSHYRRADPRIRLYRLSANQGISAARAVSLESARGVYFAINDSDDVSRSDRLAQQVALMERRPEVAVCGSNLTVITETGEPIGLRRYPASSETIWKRALRTSPIANSSACARTAAVRVAGGYDLSFPLCEDYDLWMRLLAAHRAVNIQEPLVSYRLSSEQSIQHRMKPLLESSQAIRRHWLLHPRYRSLSNLAWYWGVGLVRRLPTPVVLSLYGSLMVTRKGIDAT
jgi:glycosyltransferase involved in cell wall biosynthesis